MTDNPITWNSTGWSSGVSLALPKIVHSPPSTFEIEVVAQLKALAERLESGELHISQFSLTVNKNSQRLEIEAY